MRKENNYINLIVLCFGLFFVYPFNNLKAQGFGNNSNDTSQIRFPVQEDNNYPYEKAQESPLYLKTPSNIDEKVEYNPETNEYELYRTIGGRSYGQPVTMTIKEYTEYEHEKALKEYWGQRARGDDFDSRSSFIPKLSVGGEAFDKVFGSNTINITPQGSAELIFGFNVSRIDNYAVSEKLRKTPSFTFEERIQMNVTGSIGDKMELGINYNTEATFDFENKTKLEYSGKEDEIIKKIEAGNVTLPLTGSLITGSQSLFGLKTELQFGKLYVTTVFSQQKGETSVIEMEGGAQMNEFEVEAIDYDANKHFFLSPYFARRYEEALQNLPLISSNITITKIEVWVTNTRNDPENNRSILALTDLAEWGSNIGNRGFRDQNGVMDTTLNLPPANINNRDVVNNVYKYIADAGVRNPDGNTNVLDTLGSIRLGKNDYSKLNRARKLTDREFKFHSNLGYISLNTSLNPSDVLAVAYEYTINGKTYSVGDLSQRYTDNSTLFLKLLKGENLSPKYRPTWDLMMKNVYAIGAYQLNAEDFELNILYRDDKTGTAVPYIKEGKIQNQLLIRVFDLDRVNRQGDPKPDGVFDFYEGVTIYTSNGRIFFPTTQPFGDFLYKKITAGEMGNTELDAIAEKYVFRELYDETQTDAKQRAEKNKFIIKGRYKSSSSNEIMLNAMNVPQGSVKVTAGGQQLSEGQDFTVDYTLGRVKIINQGLLESGTPIRVSLESHSLFNIQTKTMIGTNLNYKFSDDFIIGGTILRLKETPLTKKVNIGEEPISNTIWGLNGSYNTQSQFLTTMMDKLPLIEAKEPSSIRFDAEFAQLIPGQSKSISKDGIAYIDDFEGTETSIEMKLFHTWKLASTPQGQTTSDMFPEGDETGLEYGFNRAKLAWYSIDPLFTRNLSTTPDNISGVDSLQKNHYTREVYEQEIFPEKNRSSSEPPTLNILNLAYYPDEIGPYNYVVDDTTLKNGHIYGLEDDGVLENPKSRWAGVMREINTSDFEEANVEFIEFWLMDPFVGKENHEGGYLYFNLGNVSEDVMRDQKLFFENGLPANDSLVGVNSSVWGRVPIQPDINRSFVNDPSQRKYQDVGLDGARNEIEGEIFADYSARLKALFPQYHDYIVDELKGDFSHDDFHYYRGDDYDKNNLDILERYKNYSNPDGNSPISDNDQEYPTTGTLTPDGEDINDDNTLNESENYYQYGVELRPGLMNENHPYINNVVTSTEDNYQDYKGRNVNWYQFKIPVKEFEDRFGSIDGFNSIRFMRMFFKFWDEDVVLRFAKLELVRSEWRKYELPLYAPGERETGIIGDTKFEVLSVNFEENSSKQPIEYVLPPGLDRVIDPTNPQLTQLNEQSIVLKVQDLDDDDGRAAFKNIDMDMRQYTKLKMDVHAEELEGIPLNDGDLTAFIRIGTDYINNYYEYELPLAITPDDRRYSNGIEDDRKAVWPAANFFDIDLGLFLTAKQARNDKIRAGETDLTRSFTYMVENEEHGERKITVVGNPSLSDVRVIMIGVRNPGEHGLQSLRANDGLAKSAEVWMNELRLTSFKDDGGWAANARLQARLSDLGSVNLAGSIVTPGFGSIEKKVNERAKEEITQYDISTNIQLGKLFPEKAKVNIPMYIGYSEQTISPQYNPLDKDITLDRALALYEGDKRAQDSIKDISQDKTTRKSINFTNVKVNKQSKKPMPWDPANFSVSYAYNEIEKRDIETEYDWEFSHRGTFNYLYSLRPKVVQPLNKVGFLNNKYLKLVQDFNFYYLPSRISYRTDFTRQYTEIRKRDLSLIPGAPKIDATADPNILWNWFFDLKYDLSRSLKFDYTASNMARIDEDIIGDGEFYIRQSRDESEYDSLYNKWRRQLWDNVHNDRRNTTFNHRFNANYTVPINKIPFLNWTTLTARYQGTYDWIRGPELADDTDIGHTIKNSNSIQLNNNYNFVNLYNKVGYLKRVNQETSRRPGSQPKEMKKVNYEDEDVNLFAGRFKTIEHRLKTENVEVKVLDENGNEIEVEIKIVDQNKIRVLSQEDHRGVKVMVEGEVEKSGNPLVLISQHGTRALMSVRNISISYTENNANTIYGFNQGNKLADFVHDPGIGYMSGLLMNDSLLMEKINDRNWLIPFDTLITSPMIWSKTTSLNLRSNIEPFNGFRVDVTASYNESFSEEKYYQAKDLNNGTYKYEYREGEIVTGNISMSIITLNTAFGKNIDSLNYENFKIYRKEIANRWVDRTYEKFDNFYTDRDSVNNPFYDPGIRNDSTNYPNAFGPTSQNVLIPAFLAAYTGRGVDNEDLDLPIGKELLSNLLKVLPNWRVTYDGLSKIEFMKKYFRSVNLSHSYRSVYSIASYQKNPYYQHARDNNDNDLGISVERNYLGDYIPEYEVSSVSINEQFSPLIGVDMNWKNSMTTRFELKKSRNINMSLANNQITEMVSDEFVVGVGYRFKDVQVFINQRTYKSDVNVRGDLSVRDNINRIRSLGVSTENEIIDQPTAGQKVVSFKFNADYVLNDRFNLRFFFDRVVNNPYVTSTFTTANTNIGFSITFTLTQ